MGRKIEVRSYQSDMEGHPGEISVIGRMPRYKPYLRWQAIEPTGQVFVASLGDPYRLRCLATAILEALGEHAAVKALKREQQRRRLRK